MKLFIIEDEVPIRQELTQFFEKYGFQCESSDDFHGIAQLALASGADLILLDINLPYQDGFQVCREIRQSSSVPIIVLASRNTDFDELMSLNIGADDFVSKPYNAQVRIRNRTARWFAICFPEYKDVYGDYKAVSGRMVLKEAPGAARMERKNLLNGMDVYTSRLEELLLKIEEKLKEIPYVDKRMGI